MCVLPAYINPETKLCPIIQISFVLVSFLYHETSSRVNFQGRSTQNFHLLHLQLAGLICPPAKTSLWAKLTSASGELDHCFSRGTLFSEQYVFPSFVEHPCDTRGRHHLQAASPPASIESFNTLVSENFRECSRHVWWTFPLQSSHH